MSPRHGRNNLRLRLATSRLSGCSCGDLELLRRAFLFPALRLLGGHSLGGLEISLGLLQRGLALFVRSLLFACRCVGDFGGFGGGLHRHFAFVTLPLQVRLLMLERRGPFLQLTLHLLELVAQLTGFLLAAVEGIGLSGKPFLVLGELGKSLLDGPGARCHDLLGRAPCFGDEALSLSSRAPCFGDHSLSLSSLLSDGSGGLLEIGAFSRQLLTLSRQPLSTGPRLSNNPLRLNPSRLNHRLSLTTLRLHHTPSRLQLRTPPLQRLTLSHQLLTLSRQPLSTGPRLSNNPLRLNPSRLNHRLSLTTLRLHHTPSRLQLRTPPLQRLTLSHQLLTLSRQPLSTGPRLSNNPLRLNPSRLNHRLSLTTLLRCLCGEPLSLQPHGLGVAGERRGPFLGTGPDLLRFDTGALSHRGRLILGSLERRTLALRVGEQCLGGCTNLLGFELGAGSSLGGSCVRSRQYNAPLLLDCSLLGSELGFGNRELPGLLVRVGERLLRGLLRLGNPGLLSGNSLRAPRQQLGALNLSSTHPLLRIGFDLRRPLLELPAAFILGRDQRVCFGPQPLSLF